MIREYVQNTLLLLMLMSLNQVHASKADVTNVRVECRGSCTFNVTVRHADEGWKHYADQWDVVSPDGEVLGTRILHHPHVDEQPFTRSLSGVKIPAGIREVILRARDSRHGWGGKEIRVAIPLR